MRIMGLDIGDRRIGVALSDPEEIIASPLAVVIREDDKSAVDEIVRLVNQYDVKQIVVGMPYSLSGSVGPQADKVKEFSDILSLKVITPIAFRDERLSTVAATRLLRQSAKKKAKRSSPDSAAAAFILQGYLDSLKVGDR